MSVASVRRIVGRTLRDWRSDGLLSLQRLRHRGAGKSVLVVDQLEPDPRLGAGYPRAFALIAELIDLGCRVAFYATEAERRDLARMTPVFGGKVHFVPPSGHAGLQRLLRRHGSSFDILLISRPKPMAAYAEGDWRPVARGRPFVVYDAEAVLSPLEEQRRALFGGKATAGAAALEAELAPVGLADAASAVGLGHAALIREATGKTVVILSHLTTPRLDTPGYQARRDILFVGRMVLTREQSPNVDAVVWFVGEVMPALDRLIGTDYRLHLVGLQQAAEIDALLSERVVAHGMVDDVAPLYDRCRLFVAPTRYASGLPLKLVEAMGQGIPCVATSLLNQELGASDEALPIGSSVEAFARECARLYENEAAWTATREAALSFVGGRYSRATFRASIEQLLILANPSEG